MIILDRLIWGFLGLNVSLILLCANAWSGTLSVMAQPGDLIFREGTEAVSDAVILVDRGPFSHVGLLVGEPGAWQVLHATPSEVPGRPDGVVLDPLAFFIDPLRAKQYVVYQVQASPEQRSHAIEAAYAMLGKPFRIADDIGTYCTVLVWDAWRKAGVDLDVTFTYLALPLMHGKYLLPSALLASSKLQALSSTALVLKP